MVEYLSSIYETLGSIRPQQKQTKQQQQNTKTKKAFFFKRMHIYLMYVKLRKSWYQIK